MASTGKVEMPCGTASYEIKKPGAEAPKPSSDIHPGEPICRAPAGSQPGIYWYHYARIWSQLWCKPNSGWPDGGFQEALAGNDREISMNPVYSFEAWAEDDEFQSRPAIGKPQLKATRDPEYCGPGEDYDKLSHNIPAERCEQAFRIALDGCPPYSNDDTKHVFTKKPASVYQDCFKWEITIVQN
ncbi:hypothetical protein PG996_014377 [Apiospora saccharicola]|uniref:Uncharacterized protein n=1 Tax=Apiospora saccharicola TaxID=335842 RepID=A0ABR1TI54_9PEZI